jgi:hypothetical protein
VRDSSGVPPRTLEVVKGVAQAQRAVDDFSFAGSTHRVGSAEDEDSRFISPLISLNEKKVTQFGRDCLICLGGGYRSHRL